MQCNNSQVVISNFEIMFKGSSLTLGVGGGEGREEDIKDKTKSMLCYIIVYTSVQVMVNKEKNAKLL